ncbi:MAG TPA: A/G-specific adenine glycosylase [Candidatus Omnitrophota bacterium]|nr:A/G-specific adenine glycosylase [Candidatus Omnitrophota bacterium]
MTSDAKQLAPALNAWYVKGARDLPWRRTRDPYKIWISEVMLQQTTVPTVIPYYKKWTQDYLTVKHVAGASLERILKSWQGLGYYQRARNIHKAAKLIVEKYSARIPDDYETLRTIPGFGPYTAGAVLSIAFDKRYPIVDANIRRVVMRLLAIKKQATAQVDKDVYAYLDKIMPKRNLRTFNQALMELGALVCKNKEPLCSMCPIKDRCKAFKRGIQELIPQRKEKLTHEIDVAVGIMERSDKFFIQKRPPKGLLAGLWEFPGGKVKKGETHRQALKRELKEELGITVKDAAFLTRIKHFYTKYKVNLYAYLCNTEAVLFEDRNKKWVGKGEFFRYPMPSGTAKLVKHLEDTL